MYIRFVGEPMMTNRSTLHKCRDMQKDSY